MICFRGGKEPISLPPRTGAGSSPSGKPPEPGFYSAVILFSLENREQLFEETDYKLPEGNLASR